MNQMGKFLKMTHPKSESYQNCNFIDRKIKSQFESLGNPRSRVILNDSFNHVKYSTATGSW